MGVDLTVSRLVTVVTQVGRPLNRLCINKSKGRLTTKSGANIYFCYIRRPFKWLVCPTAK